MKLIERMAVMNNRTKKIKVADIGKYLKKIVQIIGLILAVLLIVISILLFNKIKSVLSIKQVDKGIYYMDYAGRVKTDELLETDIKSISDLLEWVRKEEFYNIPVSFDEKGMGCAAFLTTTPEGNVIMGRNFDYKETDTLVIHTSSKDCYESYALADLKVLGVGSGNDLIQPDSKEGKALMLAAPYCVTDGINEAGFGAAILELEMGETHMDTERHDLSIYTAIRVLLDKCATVEEALTLLSDQDIHTGLGVSYHLFLADNTGRSVVVEWLDGEMCINDLNAATNSVLTEGIHYGDGGIDSRYDTINDTLKEQGGILTKDEARDLLKKVSQSNTEWSCVYDLTDFSFDVYMDKDFNNAINFN